MKLKEIIKEDTLYNNNIENIKDQVLKFYEGKDENVCWSPLGLIGTEVGGVMYKGMLSIDVLCNIDIKLK